MRPDFLKRQQTLNALEWAWYLFICSLPIWFHTAFAFGILMSGSPFSAWNYNGHGADQTAAVSTFGPYIFTIVFNVLFHAATVPLLFALWSLACALSALYVLNAIGILDKKVRLLGVTAYILSPYVMLNWLTHHQLDLGGFVVLPVMLGAFRHFAVRPNFHKLIFSTTIGGLAGLLFGLGISALLVIVIFYFVYAAWYALSASKEDRWRSVIASVLEVGIVAGIAAASVLPSFFSLTIYPHVAAPEHVLLPTTDLLTRLFGHPDLFSEAQIRNAPAVGWNLTLAALSAAIFLLEFALAFFALALAPTRETRVFTTLFISLLIVQLVIATPMSITIPVALVYVLLLTRTLEALVTRQISGLGRNIVVALSLAVLGLCAMPLALAAPRADAKPQTSPLVMAPRVTGAPSLSIGKWDGDFSNAVVTSQTPWTETAQILGLNLNESSHLKGLPIYVRANSIAPSALPTDFELSGIEYDLSADPNIVARYVPGWVAIVGSASDSLAIPTNPRARFNFLGNQQIWNALNSTLLYLSTAAHKFVIAGIQDSKGVPLQIIGAVWDDGWIGFGTRGPPIVQYPVTIPAHRNAIVQINEPLSGLIQVRVPAHSMALRVLGDSPRFYGFSQIGAADPGRLLLPYQDAGEYTFRAKILAPSASLVIDGRNWPASSAGSPPGVLDFGTHALGAGEHALSVRVLGQPWSEGLLSLTRTNLGNAKRVSIDDQNFVPQQFRFVVSREPAVVTLNQVFSSGWVMLPGKATWLDVLLVPVFQTSLAPHFVSNGYANSWLASPSDGRQFTIVYWPQVVVNIGLAITCATVALIFICWGLASVKPFADPSRSSHPR